MERTDLEQWKSRDVARLLALVETQRRYYQEIVASLPVGLMVLSADLSIVLANAAARKVFGLLSSDSLQRRLDTLLPSWLLDRVEEVLNSDTSQTGIVVETERGDRRFLRVGIIPIRNWDNEGTQEALLTIEDLTGVGSSSELLERPARTTTLETGAGAQTAAVVTAANLVENVDAVIWALDLATMTFAYVSPPAEQLLGFPAEHWIARNFWTERIYADDRDWVTQAYRAAIDRGEPITCEFRSLAADGSIKWMRESARLLPDARGGPGHLIGMSLDVSERRLLENQLVQAERVEAVSKLASRMAHDLNNMLMILTGYGEELLNNVPAGSPLRPDIQEILTATERMSGLTSQLLILSRRPPSEAETIELETTLNGISRRLPAAVGNHLNLEMRFSAGMNRVRANAAQLEQVVTALLNRVRTAAGRDEKVILETSRVEITEHLRRNHEPLVPGAYAVIAIAGPARLSEGETKASLFESFLPGKESLDESAVALSRAYGMVRQWGGDIAVSNGVVNGSVFRIFLPQVEIQTGGPAEPAVVEPEVAPQPEARLATVLVVEDEAGIRALVRKILRRQNYEVLEAPNGEEALTICRDYPGKIDLLITDVIMPQMGGRDLVDRLREQGKSMKVLYVSGYTDDATIYAGEHPPGTAFLQKPFTLGSLLDKVKEVLSV